MTPIPRALREILQAASMGLLLALSPVLAHCQADDQNAIWAGLNATLDAKGNIRIASTLSEAPPDLGVYEHSISQMIGGTLEGIHIVSGQDTWTLSARSSDAFRRIGLLVRGRIDPEPIIETLRAFGYNRLYITIEHPRAAYTAPAPGRLHDSDWSDTVTYSLTIPIPDTVAPPVIRISYGYRTLDLIALWTPLACVLLTPIVLTLWMRRQALNTVGADTTAVWFSYLRWTRLGINGMMMAWFALAIVLRAHQFWMLVFNMSSSVGGTALFMFTLCEPPMISQLICSGLDYPVYAGVRGSELTRRELIAQTFWAQSAMVLPLTLLLTGVAALFGSLAQQGVLLIAAAVAVRTFTIGRFVSARRISPSAVTVGDMRDRLFGLAGSAHVNLKQIYYLSAAKSRMANAFARIGNDILVTDYLLEHLSRREVDAVMAHELGHLKHRHPARLTRALVLAYALPAVVVYGAASKDPAHANLWFALFPLAMLPALFLYTARSRRFEYVADQEAVRLTGDPAALITGLVKVTRLGMFPLEWGAGRMLTHPSTLRRARAIAAAAGIQEAQLQNLLEGSEHDPDRYDLPAPAANVPPLFSTTFKQALAIRYTWIGLTLSAVLPTVFAWIAGTWQLTSSAAWTWWLLGASVTFPLVIVAQNRMAAAGVARLAPQIAARLDLDRQGADGESTVYVLFAPDSTCRVYEGFYNWDVGFVVLEADCLCYRGEQARFGLRRDQIVDASITADIPGWRRTAVVSIRWQDAGGGRSGGFRIWPGKSVSATEHSRRTRSLHQEIEAWRRQPEMSAAANASEPVAGLPDIGRVTSLSPGELARSSRLLPSLVFRSVFGAGVAVAFGLPLSLTLHGNGWYVVWVSVLCGLLMWIPLYRYREA